MTDTAIKNALRRRGEIGQEIDQYEGAIKKAKAELERINAFISAWHDFADEEAKRELAAVSDVAIAPHSDAKIVNPKKEEIAEIAAKAIQSAGRPLSRAEIFKTLEDYGVSLSGKDPEMVLSTMLWRMRSKIVRLKPYGYWVADKPYPRAGYDPDKQSHQKNSANADRELLDER